MCDFIYKGKRYKLDDGVNQASAVVRFNRQYFNFTLMNDFKPPINHAEIPLNFEELFKDNFKALCYFAFQFLKNMAEAEDVVQDTFIKFWDKRVDFNNEPAVKSFLYITVRNACLNIKRHKQVILNHAEIQPVDLHIEKTDFLNNIIKSEILGHVYHAVESLPDGCKRIFKLSYFEELKNPQIAKMLEVTVNTVKTQKYRAIKLLHKKLHPLFKSQVIEMALLIFFFSFF